ncbi:MAG: DUF3263 domain-containing protein [Aurantimicrobium sp.]|uniref:DUF3263 domain-containing protein n=1 Tax=Aurantimicrobium TaxID=1705353 RepID=UPI0024065B98|nr:DUF3263 domain-containing protein [Aurantimicrobium minutum]MDF9809654.1 hypothetical protein [Aurantimicrobium minutum]MDH6537358.1 hypothetical protein [Aurantimicrobium minutum]
MFDERDRAILDFEREWWQHPGAKEDAIRQTFGLSPARYYQVLGKLMDSEAALAYDPMLVKRLQRVRDDRRSSRQKRVNPDSSEKN